MTEPTDKESNMETEKRDPGYPYGQMDAREWAEEFGRIFPEAVEQVRGGADTMLGWFANAIMTGYDQAKR
jgi:hypothetical protein